MKKKERIFVEPSILAADFGRLTEEAQKAEGAGADALHLDVMDGHFVRNLTLGPKTVAAINRATDLFLDVHLMLYNPFDFVERFVQAGADRIIIHFEATEEVEETLNYIRKCNVQAGLAFNPETSESMIPKYLNLCDLILLMSVNPGFGGQTFMPKVLKKVKFTRDICDQLKIRKGGVIQTTHEILEPFDIQVDGGIDDIIAAECIKAGANHIVSGTYLYGAQNMREAIEQLRNAK
jgi:ribulose-phosphate 3-epimerase